MVWQSLTIETMTHCEAEVVSKEIAGEDGVAEVLGLLERLRSNQFQAVVWDDDAYVGGIWYNPIYKRWTAEFWDVEWGNAEEAAAVQHHFEQSAPAK